MVGEERLNIHFAIDFLRLVKVKRTLIVLYILFWLVFFSGIVLIAITGNVAFLLVSVFGSLVCSLGISWLSS